MPPYILYEILDVETDAPVAVQRANISIRLTVVSQYKGLKEVSLIMSNIRDVLESKTLAFESGATAALRLNKKDIILNQDSTRSGICQFQAWIKL